MDISHEGDPSIMNLLAEVHSQLIGQAILQQK